jgi:hypothetical protein
VPAAEPLFKRVGAGPIFRLTPAPAAGWIGYFSSAMPRRASLTLAQAWAETGVYLVSDRRPHAVDLIAQEIARLQAAGQVRGVWLAESRASQPRVMATLHAVVDSSGAWRVTVPATFRHGEYRLDISAGTTLTLAAAPDFGLEVGAGEVRFGRPHGDIHLAERSLRLPFVGAGAGAWVGSLALPGDPDGISTLGVGLRYALSVSSGAEQARPHVVHMPVLRQAGQEVDGRLVFDVLRPGDPERTQLILLPMPGQGLLSGFTTTDGYDVHVAPTSLAGLSARLVFCSSPSAMDDGEPEQPYLAPDGPFALTVDGPRRELGLGPSGVESVQIGADSGSIMLFRAGKPAFAPRRGPALLTSAATTSYLTVLGPAGGGGLIYHAQPPEAPLFRDAAGGVLQAVQVASGLLPKLEDAADCPTLPVGPFRWLDPDAAPSALTLEREALAPLRRDTIPPELDLAMALEDAGTLVTPQGFVIETSETRRSQIKIASLPGADPPTLVLTDVKGPFGAALQSGQAFVVVADPEAYFGAGSIRYQLREDQIDRLRVPPEVRTALKKVLSPQSYREYETECDFAAVAEAASGASWQVVRAAAGRLVADIDGWRFDLSPRAWRTDPRSRTIMLIKFASASLASLVADPARWSWQAAAGDLAKAKRDIEDVFATAMASPAGSDLAAFSKDVATNAAWNGVLVLNAQVQLEELPPDLRFVAAGTKREQFFGHHVALTLTAVGPDTGGARQAASAISALIAYDDSTDLVMTENVPFAFKAFTINVRFGNGAVTGFTAQVELMVNRLFGALVRKLAPERGNNLVLDGAYQVQQGLPVYQFVLRGVNQYVVAQSALETVTVTAVRLEMATSVGEAAFDFVLSGGLEFRELPDADVFSFDALSFSNLRVRMTPASGGPAFTVDETGIALDPTTSTVRAQSLAARFPAKVSRLIAITPDPAAGSATPPRTPQVLGYAPVLAPISAVPIEPPWYGVVFRVDLGSNGSLAGDAPLALEVLAAWAPGEDEEIRVYLGANAGGAVGDGWSFQGVLRLGFRTFQLIVQEATSGGVPTRDYALRLGRFGLTAMGATFPPGQADLFLFASPDDPQSSLGWYAAYATPSPETPKSG